MMRLSCAVVSSWRVWWMSSASMLKASGRSSAWQWRPRPTSTASSSITSNLLKNELHAQNPPSHSLPQACEEAGVKQPCCGEACLLRVVVSAWRAAMSSSLRMLAWSGHVCSAPTRAAATASCTRKPHTQPKVADNARESAGSRGRVADLVRLDEAAAG